MTCSNCKTTLGCSCQRKTASNGVSVCNTCLATYEASLKGLTVPKPGTPQVRTFRAPNSK